MMKNDQQYQSSKRLSGLLALAAGVVLFALSFFIKSYPSWAGYYKLLQGIGFFLILGGAIMLVQAYLMRKNPAVMEREMIDQLDERKTWIRYRSGYNAFIFATATTYLALLVVGRTSITINPDLAWWVLAGIVVVTLIVFIVSMVIYESKY